MKRLIPILLTVLAFTSCNKFKGKQFVDHLSPYETPPRPPVPPQDYCFELKGNDGITALHLIVTGDSLSGELNHIYGPKNQTNGTIKGIKYGTSLLLTYRNTQDQLNKPEDQEWKMDGDTIYKIRTATLPNDSMATSDIDSGAVVIELVLHKAACR